MTIKTWPFQKTFKKELNILFDRLVVNSEEMWDRVDRLECLVNTCAPAGLLYAHYISEPMRLRVVWDARITTEAEIKKWLKKYGVL
ncbi:hypothetical protein HY844_02390 [Candidatus Berkelbacteria bacterium]|nr:hypothetical protein [Candidatus Berkelbacteria bacterium]